MSVKILSQRDLYQDDRITFIEKAARYPNAAEIRRGCILHPGSVVIVPFTDDGEVLLIRQYRLGVEAYLLEIPAGTLEKDEDPLNAARRELQEEAGYYPETLIPLDGFYISPGISNEYMHLFIARNLHPSTLEMDVDELIEVIPMPLNEALRRISTNEIRDAKSIVGLLRAASSQAI
jgi:ADP-ribose pyrophosphatase